MLSLTVKIVSNSQFPSLGPSDIIPRCCHAAVWDKSIFWLAGGTDTSLSFFRLVEKILKNFAILAEGNVYAFIARFG